MGSDLYMEHRDKASENLARTVAELATAMERIHELELALTKAAKTTLRPMDIAWEAYLAGESKEDFQEWWDSHPQTTPDGYLK